MYEWLAVNGAKAQFKGAGTINGLGDYGFMVTTLDGDVEGGGGMDRFRIKVWQRASGEVVFDTQPGAADTEDPTTVVEGGSIVIHKR